MKISKETIAVMKNFASINSNLLIKEGSKLSTLNSASNVLASATVAETFPIDFGIYDTNEFLGVLSLFNEPEIEFKEKFARVSDNGSGVKFYAADPSVLLVPKKEIKFPATDIEFDLSANQLATIMKTSAVLRAPDVSVVGADGELSIVVGDLKNATSNTFDIKIGDTDKVFTANFRVENLKLMPTDYAVSISSKKISKFVSVDGNVTVFIALESTSSFE
jgi:hypothetical protein